MPIDDSSIIPKYYQLKELLIEYIRENNYKEGALLPSENELIKKYSVSRNTVRQAFNTLEKDGIVYKVQGKGTFYRGEPKEEKKQNYLLGVISPVTSKSIYLDIIHGIEEYAHQHDYHIILSNSNADPEKEEETLEAMLEKGIDGLIIEPALSRNIKQDSYIFQKLSSLTIPVVIIDCYIKGLKKPSITLDDNKYGYGATKYLIEHHHHRIAFIYKSEVIPGELRFQGYKKALKEAGIPFDPELAVSFYEAEEKEGGNPPARITNALMNLSNPPTAILYFNDENAFLGVQALRRMGYSIPEDVSVMGIDDSYFATISEIPLTTLVHPKRDMGIMAAEMVINEINTPGVLKNKCTYIQPEIVVRNSIASLESNP